MSLDFNIFSFLLFLAALPTGAICYILIQKEGASKQFGFMMGVTTIWAVAYGLELMSHELEMMLFWIRIEYLGISLIPAYLIQFTLAFTGREALIHTRNQISWFLVPVLTLAMVATTPGHAYHYASVAIDMGGPFPMLSFSPGPWYWIHTTYFYTIMVWTLVELVRRYRSTEGLYRRQALIIIIGALLPWFVNGLYLSGFRPFGRLDLTPFAFLATGLVISYGLLRFKLFELLPIARDKLIEGMSDGVMVLDVLGRIVDANPMMRRLLEQVDGTLIGKTPADLFRERPEIGRFITQSEERRITVTLGPDDRLRSLQVQMTPLTDSGKGNVRSGTLLVWRDVTEQERFERELLEAKRKTEESDRLKTAFLANVSHEIRNPMHAIMGFAQIIRETGTSDEERDRYAEIISQSSKRLLDLINDIIDLSKLEAGQNKAVMVPGDIRAVADEVAQLLGPTAVHKGLAFQVESELEPGDEILVTDHAKVRQILINLVSNAIRFTDEGRVGIRIRKVSGHVFLTVSDTGVGIERSQHKAIFERFRQADDRSPRHIGGTGLGLAISRAYANLIGAELSVDSSKGQGSQFTLRLPFTQTGRIPMPEPARSDTDTRYPDLSGHRILLAEDEPMNVKYLDVVFRKANADLLVATTGAEAVELALSNEVSVVLMDIRMPEMDGFEASARIRAVKPDLLIIGLSGHAMVEEDKVSAAGMNEMMTKPVQGLEILARIQAYLGPALS